MRPQTILDDRNPPRRVTLWTPWEEHSDVPADLRSRIAESIDNEWQISGLTSSVNGLQAAMMLLGAAMMMLAAIAIPLLWVRVPLLGAGMVGITWAGRSLTLKKKAAEVRDALLSDSRCASCGYDLGGCMAGEGGLWTCPECDAAWDLDACRASRGPGSAILRAGRG